MGGIISDDKGLVMAAFTQVIPLPTSIEMVEVLAACRALYFARKLEFDQVIIEGDSEIIIMALNSEIFPAQALAVSSMTSNSSRQTSGNQFSVILVDKVTK